MSLTTDCMNPDCTSEDAYHNGVEYECPECGYTWEDDLNMEWDED